MPNSMEWQEAWERQQQRADDLEVEVKRLRDLLSDAEGWFEEIQHAGYAVPHGYGKKFIDFWDRLQAEEERVYEEVKVG